MKAVIKIAIPALTLTFFATAFACGARSQMTAPLKKDQPAVVSGQSGPTTPVPTNEFTIFPDSLSPESGKIATVQSLTRAIARFVKEQIPGSAAGLRSSKNIDITIMIDTDKIVAAWHSVNVKASYDARLIGGILSIHVGLAPVFGGIGSAVRSVNNREFQEAITDDVFNDDFIAQAILRLTKELGDEYAAK